MKNKKILVGLLIASVTTAGLSYSYADNSMSSGSTQTKKEFKHNTGFEKGNNMIGMGRGFNGIDLTDTEKESLKTMTADQKKAFFEQKMQAQRNGRDAREAVIDKLLAGQTLTADEEIVRQEIIKERADVKARQAEMQEIKTIMQKKRNGESLTTDEQTKLDTFQANHQGMGKGRK